MSLTCWICNRNGRTWYTGRMMKKVIFVIVILLLIVGLVAPLLAFR
jgi:hypothetical protein